MTGLFPRILLAAAVAPWLSATVVPRLDLPDLVRSAETVVHGRVLRHWSDWDTAHQFIWTHSVIAVTDVLKGTAPATVTVSEPGGAAGGMVLRVAGVTEYADGEEVVVFLHRIPNGYWRSYGWRQGKYTVTRAFDGTRRVHVALEGLALALPAGRGTPQQLTTQSPLLRLNGMELDAFRRLVQAEAAR